MRVFILLLGGWILGVAVYWVVGSILDGHLMGSGDLSAAALYSAVMLAVTAPVIYLPAMWWIRRRTSHRHAAFIMTVAIVAQTVIATALVFASFGALRLRSFVTPEALLFYVIFGTAGIVVGVGATRA